jgi:hypothetical protein
MLIFRISEIIGGWLDPDNCANDDPPAAIALAVAKPRNKR